MDQRNMTSMREALAAALELFEVVHGQKTSFPEIVAAARERLAQLPEKCGTCNGTGNDEKPAAKDLIDAFGHLAFKKGETMVFTCPSCHGRGVLYPPALVERIARVVEDSEGWEIPAAVAVLDALNTETP